MKLSVALAFVLLFVLTPVGFTADGRVAMNEACAMGGTCCTETGSTCVNGGKVTENAYYAETGCKQQDS